MLPGSTVIVNEDKTATQIGVSFFKPPKLIAREGNRALFQVFGGTGWQGIGHQGYYPTRYAVVELDFITEGSQGSHVLFRALVVKIIKELEPGKKWKAAVKELLELVCEDNDGKAKHG